MRFVVMADPQFGMFAAASRKTPEEIAAAARRGIHFRPAPRTEGFAQETELFEVAIARANRLKPAFVIVCGDMTNDPNSEAQRAELWRIAGKLDRSIPIRWVAGNHDCGADTVVPTPESLAMYRRHFGPDYYSFEIAAGGDPSLFVVVNTSLLAHPHNVRSEFDAQFEFLERTLAGVSAGTYRHVVAFGHHPLFLDSAGEADAYWTVPGAARGRVLGLFREHGVRTMFSGHLHRNNYARDGDFEMVSSGPIGYPLGNDPSGYRIVTLSDRTVRHRYVSLESQDVEGMEV